MTFFDALRKALLAGFGVQEKVKELIDELVEKGELSEKQGAKLIKEWSGKAEKSTSDLNKTLSDLVTNTLNRMNIPTKDDLDKVDRKLRSVSTRIKKLEEKAGEES
jgi:polyhydroxyalkanoate synthesis regulator phasin